MKVENNNVVIWKGSKLIKGNVDHVRIYHPREWDEGIMETDGLNGERSRAEQVETEGNKGLARGKWQIKRMMSEGSTESCNDREGRHQSERRLLVRINGRKRPGTRNMTRREAAVDRKVLSRKSSPGPP
ncbi:hypothetical protein NPIL_220601 [Nephila pilipes]|uniref:Uncharacterized protein n=1 Tax=Nephila pilipes TaxID=299642 RepID=A0A8X6QNS9_NEPPI|nr:hypothetical protein NPIL_220601 [Nephila pilipes]